MSRIAMKKLPLFTATALVLSAAMASSAWADRCAVDPKSCPPKKVDGGGGGADSGPKGVYINQTNEAYGLGSGNDGGNTHNGYATAGEGSNGGGSSGVGSSNQSGKAKIILTTGSPELDAVATDSGLTVVQPSKNTGQLPDVSNDPAYTKAYDQAFADRILYDKGAHTWNATTDTITFDVVRPDGGIDQVRITENDKTGITTRSITNENGTTNSNYINPGDFHKQYENAYDQASKGASFINGVKKFDVARPDGSGFDEVTIHKAQKNGGPVTIVHHSHPPRSATGRDGNPSGQKGPGSITLTKKDGTTTARTSAEAHVTGASGTSGKPGTGAANRAKLKADPVALATAQAKAREAATAPSAPHTPRSPPSRKAATDAGTQASATQNKPKSPVSITAASVASAGFMANSAQRVH